jgi:XisI protein
MAVEQYRQYITTLLSERAQRSTGLSKAEEYEVQTLFDIEQDHYQLLHVGWCANRRKFDCILHLDIKNGQIWVQNDYTEEGIANRLVEMGVPRNDIVLAFHEPSVRQYTEFSTGKEQSLQLHTSS